MSTPVKSFIAHCRTTALSFDTNLGIRKGFSWISYSEFQHSTKLDRMADRSSVKYVNVQEEGGMPRLTR